MTTDTKRSVVVAGGPIGGLAPQDLDQAYRLAQALSLAGEMVPAPFRGKPEATLAAMLKGAELGLSPMQSLGNIAVVNGRPAMWGDAIPALIQRAGHHLDVRVEGEGDAAVAIATLTRRDTGATIERRFSMADAKRANLAGKDVWKAYPTRMLAMRARSWAARDGAADVLMGLGVADELLDHVGPDRAIDVTPAAQDPAQREPLDPTDLARDLRAAIRDAETLDQVRLALARNAEQLARLRDLDRDLADEVEAFAELTARELQRE